MELVQWTLKIFWFLTIYSVLQPVPASGKDLERFHSKDYVSCLQKAEENENEEDFEKLLEEFGIGIVLFKRLSVFEVTGLNMLQESCL